MAQNHDLKKAQEIVDASVEAVQDKSTIMQGVRRESMDEFKGKANDTITVRVKGTLPVRTQEFRNDRKQPIVTDQYEETLVTVKIEPETLYSATEITDEQKDFDFNGDFGRLFDAQTDVIVEKAERGILSRVLNAPYERRIAIDSSPAVIEAMARINRDPYHVAITKAKQSIKRMGGDTSKLVAWVGVNVAEEIMVSQKLVADAGTGDSALQTATLGRVAGVVIVEDHRVGANDIYVNDESAFVFYNSAPSVPDSVPFGATQNKGGISLRWIKDYSSGFTNDRSVFSTWVGYGETKDQVLVWAGDQMLRGEEEHFIRGVRLSIAADVGFEKQPGDGSTDTLGGGAGTFLAKKWNETLADSIAGAGKPFPGVMQADGWGADTVPAG